LAHKHPGQQAKHKDPGGPLKPPLAADVPPAPEDHDPSHKGARCKPDQTPIWKIWLDILTFVAVVIAAVAYWMQLGAMIDANKLSRESLESVQRAFLVFVGIDKGVRTKDHEAQHFYDFRGAFQNNGATPAINVVGHFKVVSSFSTPIPESEFQGTGHSPSVTIGPKMTQETEPKSVYERSILGRDLADDLHDLPHDSKTLPILTYGWVVYRDVLPNTAPHLTEFCQLLTGAKPMGVPVKYGGTPVVLAGDFGFEWRTCSEHSCTDEYCPDYKEIVKLAYGETH
jgi:hypothetical protein